MTDTKDTHRRGRLLPRPGEADRARAVELTAHFALGFFMSMGGLVWGIHPFGIALVAAVKPGAVGITALLGTLLGTAALGDLTTAAVYASALILTATLASTQRRGRFAGDPAVAPAAAATAAILSAALRCLMQKVSAATLAAGLTEILMAGFSASLFRLGLRARDPESVRGAVQSVGLALLLGAALTGLQPLCIFGEASVGRILAVLLVEMAALAGGPGPGAVAGALFGLMMDMAGGTMFLYGAACGLSGALMGVVRSRGRLLAVLTYCLADGVVVLWHAVGGEAAILYETLTASILVMLVPRRTLLQVGEYLPSGMLDSGLVRARRGMRDRVRLSQRAFRRLAESVDTMTAAEKNDENYSGIFERAALGVCRRCPGAKTCWQAEYSSTMGYLDDAVGPMLERGELLVDDLPQGFLSRCVRPADYAASVNAELKAWLCRKQYRARFNENLSAVSSRYRDVSQVFSRLAEELDEDPVPQARLERRLRSYLRAEKLSVSGIVYRDGRDRLHAELAGSGLEALQKDTRWLDKISAVLGEKLRTGTEPEDGRLVLLEAEELTAVVGTASAKRRGRGVSGDGSTAFTTDDGRLCVILSDGMGTGKEAGEMSRSSIQALADFLRAGVEAETALGLLESLMILKNETDVVSATVDMLVVDLMTGEGSLYKCGSAPTYLRRREGVRCIRAGGYAPGLTPVGEDQTQITKLKLREGDMAVIISDGVLAGEGDAWFRGLLEELSDGPRELARKIAEASALRYGASDDVTVLAVSIQAPGSS